jgi:hypothetical protein
VKYRGKLSKICTILHAEKRAEEVPLKQLVGEISWKKPPLPPPTPPPPRGKRKEPWQIEKSNLINVRKYFPETVGRPAEFHFKEREPPPPSPHRAALRLWIFISISCGNISLCDTELYSTVPSTTIMLLQGAGGTPQVDSRISIKTWKTKYCLPIGNIVRTINVLPNCMERVHDTSTPF